MKKSIQTVLIAFACFAFVGIAQAQDSGSHSHNGEQVGQTSRGMMGGHMSMDQMHGMMQECMKSHKDGMMCNHQMMEKCQSNMSKMDCQKMMNEMNAKSK